MMYVMKQWKSWSRADSPKHEYINAMSVYAFSTQENGLSMGKLLSLNTKVGDQGHYQQ